MKCSVCNGTGLVGIGQGIRGLKRCEACYGTGVIGEKRHGFWEAYYVCSCCGETVRKVVAECPFCHARMDGGDLVGSANEKM